METKRKVLVGLDYHRTEGIEFIPTKAKTAAESDETTKIPDELGKPMTFSPTVVGDLHVESSFIQKGFLGWLWGFFKRNVLQIIVFTIIVGGGIGLARYFGYFVPETYFICLLLFVLGWGFTIIEFIKFNNRKSLLVVNTKLNELNANTEANFRKCSEGVVELERRLSEHINKNWFRLEQSCTALNRDTHEKCLKLSSAYRERIDEFHNRLNAIQLEYRREHYEISESLHRSLKKYRGEFERYLQNEADLYRDKLSNEREMFSKTLGERFDAYLKEIEDLSKKVAKLGKESLVSDLKKELIDEKKRSIEFQNRTERILYHLNDVNSSMAQVHQRYLHPEQASRIVDYWMPKLGVQLSKRALSYLAHQICQIENALQGRLATTIPAALLRVIAMRRLKGETLNVLEIGTLFGISSCVLKTLGSTEAKQINLTVIDPLTGYYGKGTLDPQTGVPVNRVTLEANFKTMGFGKNEYEIIEEFSQDPKAVEAASKKEYDYIILDGDHSYDGLAADYELYNSLLKPGGILVFDDYDTPEWPDIRRVVVEKVLGDERWEWLGGEWRTGLFRLKET